MKPSNFVNNTIAHLSHTDIASDARILKELESLRAQFVNCKIFGIGISRDDFRNKTVIKDVDLISLRIKSRNLSLIPASLRHILTFLEIFVRATKIIRTIKPQIIHCHDVYLLPIALYCQKMLKSKLIYDAHELESEASGITKFQKKVIRYFEKKAWKSLNGLITVSPSITNWYHKKYGVVNSVIVLNSPIVSDEYDKIFDDYLRRKFKICHDSLVFIYIGIIGKGRGVDNLLAAFSSNDVKSHLVFLGYGEYVGKVKNLEEENKRIHFHESVPYKDVIPIARSADYGLCLLENISLSDYYCLPNKLFEYAFSGIPVLATNFPEIKDTVLRYKLGYVTGNDPETIHKTVLKIESETKHERIKATSLYDLTWNKQKENLISLYNSVIEIDT